MATKHTENTTKGRGVTALLAAARAGDPAALDAVLPLVYEELRRVARAQMRRERPGQTLDATALVHEAWLRLAGSRDIDAGNRTHFVAIAARIMRQVLIERARARHAAKRGGHRERITLDEGLLPDAGRPIDLLALDDALERLAALDPDNARLVELRFFGGLTVEEAAEALHTSPATIKRRWALARAFLLRELVPEP
jgi:RNA polymerase sigma-70 factor (ECF subfamily)